MKFWIRVFCNSVSYRLCWSSCRWDPWNRTCDGCNQVQSLRSTSEISGFLKCKCRETKRTTPKMARRWRTSAFHSEKTIAASRGPPHVSIDAMSELEASRWKVNSSNDYLVGGFNHLEKYQSMGRIIPYIMENKKCWNHQPVSVYIINNHVPLFPANQKNIETYHNPLKTVLTYTKIM